MIPELLLQTSLHGDPIDAINAIAELRDLLDTAETTHALTLRRHGATWRSIGEHLNISTQAAHRRYAHWEPTQT